jgi:hypothetical protein
MPSVALASAPATTTQRPRNLSGRERCGEVAAMMAVATASRTAGKTAGGSDETRERKLSLHSVPARLPTIAPAPNARPADSTWSARSRSRPRAAMASTISAIAHANSRS